jgi:hypothetical protein
MNTWMNNSQYLAQVGHFFGAYFVVVTTAMFFKSWHVVLPVLAVGIVVAAIKEFWYDLKYELPKQSFSDSFEDFAFYMLGAGTATVVTMLSVLKGIRP